MLRGDLGEASLAGLLKQLAADGATGCIYVRPGSAAGGHPPDARIALRAGAVSNVAVPGHEDAVAARLLVTGRLTEAALAEARQAQQNGPTGWSIPDLLIQLGLADPHVVATLLLEQALADLSLLCSWTAGTWHFRRREPSGPALPTPLPVAELLAAVEARHAEWRELLPFVGGAEAVVSLAPASSPDGTSLELAPDDYGLLCAVDGTRTVAALASAVGSTVLDTARSVARLVQAGLVRVELGADDLELLDDELLDDGDEDLAGGSQASTVAAIMHAFARRDPDVRSSASMLLSQLADEPPAAPQPPAVRQPPVPAWHDAALTDTAALMRELTSLGSDDSAASVTRTTTPTAGALRERERLAQQSRKRKGLFGRS